MLGLVATQPSLDTCTLLLQHVLLRGTWVPPNADVALGSHPMLTWQVTGQAVWLLMWQWAPQGQQQPKATLKRASDNTGSGIARRIVIKTGLNVILACNIPKDNPMLEVNAEKRLVQKLIELGYAKPKSKGLSS
ncbi:uncharacterized protein LOC141676506 isoform X2 [Apium graveolens]|uniref:uncharacterized protein LOC141676506 isoform X2 n=1 Tax=Apium graveolens TaxID=4045 RepID=UPI003D78FB5B